MFRVDRLLRTSAAALCCLLTGWTSAQVPDELHYQGYLTNSVGVPLDNSVAVTISLYAVESGGTPLWSDTLNIVPEQGLFTATLGGAGAPFPVGLFDTPVYLAIQVGEDAEMAPRRALLPSAYAMRAVDADSLQGLPPSALDQSGEVATLQADLAGANASIDTNAGNIASAAADATSALSQAGTNQSNIASTQSDVVALETDVGTLQTDVTGIENQLPSLQARVTDTCGSGSAIRAISPSGTVTCEVDDGSQWSFFNSDLYYSGGNVGIGTGSPSAYLQVDAPVDTDSLRARVDGITKLMVHGNGSVTVGTNVSGDDDTFRVMLPSFLLGDTTIGSSTAGSARFNVTDADWQMTLGNTGTGGNTWYVGSSSDGWGAGGGKFIVSPSSGSAGSALAIDASRNVGIDNESPSTRLHVLGGTDVSTTGGGYVTIGSDSGNNIALDSNEIMARSNGAAATLNLNANGGEVRINSGGVYTDSALDVVGEVNFELGLGAGKSISFNTNVNPAHPAIEPSDFETGTVGKQFSPFFRMYSKEFYAATPIGFLAYSDASLKRDVRPIDDALGTVMALEGVTYELLRHPSDDRVEPLHTKEQYDREHQLGFIAQDVEKILPQLVTQDEESGLKSVGYMGVIPILVEAIKAQQAQIEAQRQELDALKARLR